MLKIQGKESYYTLCKSVNEVNNDPIYTIKVKNKKNIDFNTWYNKNMVEIDKLVDLLLDGIINLNTSDKYFIYIKLDTIKYNLIKLIYNTSENTKKDFLLI